MGIRNNKEVSVASMDRVREVARLMSEGRTGEAERILATLPKSLLLEVAQVLREMLKDCDTSQ